MRRKFQRLTRLRSELRRGKTSARRAVAPSEGGSNLRAVLMNDCFALFDERRRPWIDPDLLKQKFLARSAEFHPDRVHSASTQERRAAQERYTELNTAYNCLRDPKERLAHLLELERGAKPTQVQDIPSGLMSLSLEVGQICREADAFLAEKAKVTSPLLKVRMFQRNQDCTDKLLELQKALGARYEAVIAQLKTVDADWEASGTRDSSIRAANLDRLEELAQLFSYFKRWRQQIQERIVQLSF